MLAAQRKTLEDLGAESRSIASLHRIASTKPFGTRCPSSELLGLCDRSSTQSKNAGEKRARRSPHPSCLGNVIRRPFFETPYRIEGDVPPRVTPIRGAQSELLWLGILRHIKGMQWRAGRRNGGSTFCPIRRRRGYVIHFRPSSTSANVLFWIMQEAEKASASVPKQALNTVMRGAFSIFAFAGSSEARRHITTLSEQL